jgi:integration host factor subunit beta
VFVDVALHYVFNRHRPVGAPPKMTKSELIAKLAEHYSLLTTKDAEAVVKTILEAMFTSLVQGRRIEIRGFGSFTINHRPARTGRNPKTGENVPVPEKCVPHFKPGRELRDRVDSKIFKARLGQRKAIL